MTIDTRPIYNLKAVVQETGIAPDTLRAWERRYGIPVPQRTQGGHRLYSELDIQTLKWLKKRTDEGLSISRAVEMLKNLQAEGKDPLQKTAVPTRALAEREPVWNLAPAASSSYYIPTETSLEALRAQWLAACLNFNETKAEQVLNQAFGMYPIETVCLDLLSRGLSEIGMLWYENRASVQQEHFASGLAMRRLDMLLAASPAPGRNHTILVGCPPNEWHTFTSLMMTLFLRRRGLHVIYLGANVPAARFAETLEATQPHIVILSAQQLPTAASLQQTAADLSRHGAVVAFGGRIFDLHHPDLTRRIAGHFLGHSLEEAIGSVETLLIRRPPLPRQENGIQPLHSALQALQEKRSLLENHVREGFVIHGYDMEYLANANQFFGDNLAAALQLGNLRYLDTEMEWLRTLLNVHHLPEHALTSYLTLYADALRNHLGESANPILEWMAVSRW